MANPKLSDLLNLLAPPNEQFALEEIIANKQLEQRPSRAADFKAEAEGLVELSEALADSPDEILQKLSDVAMRLCGAESAGVSIAETENGNEIFRWRGVAGKLKPFLLGTMPRHFSPCGHVFKTGSPQLMVKMIGHYHYVSKLGLPLYEVLLVPFSSDGKLVGTIWVVAHTPEKKFDSEDLRVLESLSRFASAAYRSRTDAAERKKVEERLSATIEVSKVGFYDWDIVNNKVVFSPQMQRDWGIEAGVSLEEILLRIDSQDRERVQKLIANIIQTREPYHAEYRVVRPDNSVVWIQARGKVTYDNDLKPIRFFGTSVDVTDQIAVRNTIEESKRAIENERANFRNLFKQTPEMVCILSGPDHIFDFVNEAHVRVLGFNATGKTVREAQPESVEVHAILDGVYQTGKTAELFEIPVTIGARLRYFNLTYAARKDDSGKISGIMILGTEVTDEVLSRESSKLQSKALELALNGAPMTSVLDVLCQMVEIQSGGALVSSILLADQQGKHLLHGGGPSLPPEYNNAVNGMAIGSGIGSCGTAAATGKVVVVEDIQTDPLWKDFKHLASTHGLAACWSTPILTAQGKLLGTFAFYSRSPRRPTARELGIAEVTAHTTALIVERQLEIAERHASEKRLKIALVGGKMGAWNIDLQSQVLTGDAKFREIHGLSLEEENLHETIARNAHPDDRILIRTALETAIKQGVPYICEYRIKALDGSYRWVFARGEPRYSQKNEPQSLAGISIDIDERKQAELSLQKAKDAAERTSQTKSSFLANMSHEIRTPLGAILGFADLLRERNLDSKEREQFIDTIARNGKVLTKIIDDILDLAKVESGKLEIEMVEFSLEDLVDEVMDLFREQTRAKNLYLRAHFAKDTSPRLIADPTRLRQILINIVGNAVKFTSEGGVTIDIHHEPQSGNKVRLIMSVRDTGPGLSSDQRERLFQPFMQADNSTTRKFGGTGLGLSLSQRLAHALGGSIKIEDCEPGAGCVFTISISAELPNAKSESNRTKKLELLSRDGKNELPLDGVRILVADDSKDNQFLVERMLTKYGAAVTIADNGLIACRKGIEGNFDLVLMDIQMPEMDGYEATRSLREAGFKKPIIALTAHAMAEERARTFAAGCDGHLTKPLNQADLIGTVLLHTTKPNDDGLPRKDH